MLAAFLPDAFTLTHLELIVALTARHRLASIYPFRVFTVNGSVSLAPLQNKVRCCEIMIDAGQYDGEVRGRISIHVGLNKCIAATLKPGNFVGNDS